MSGIRSITRRATAAGYATAGSAPLYVNSSDNSVRVIPIGSGTAEVSLAQTVSTGAVKIAAGTGTFVSGTVTVATGLATCTSFNATLIGTGATATGATEIEQCVVASITTGAVVVNGSYHSGTAAVMVQSVSGTAAFYWQAYGT
jgi:hypothetical protein